MVTEKAIDGKVDRNYYLCILDSKDEKAVSVYYRESEQAAGKKFMRDKRITKEQLDNDDAYIFVRRFGEPPLIGDYLFTFSDDLVWAGKSDKPLDRIMLHLAKCPIGWLNDSKLRVSKGFDDNEFVKWKLSLDYMIKELWYEKSGLPVDVAKETEGCDHGEIGTYCRECGHVFEPYDGQVRWYKKKEEGKCPTKDGDNGEKEGL
jgi:hypothetical protein